MYIEDSFYEKWHNIGPYTYRNEQTDWVRDIFERDFNCRLV